MVRTALALILTMAAATLRAGELPTDVHPLPTRNLNPYVQIFGMPPMEGGRLTPEGESHYSLLFDLANNSIQGEAGPEALTLDGETYRAALIWRHGLTPKIEVGMELPYIAHSGGVLDNFIEGWHDLFGLTNGRRDDRPSNTLDYRYRWEGETLMGFTDPVSGFGDLRLFASHALIRQEARWLKASVSLKLPTGNEKQLLGSGDADFAIYLSGTDNLLLARYDLVSFGQLGVLMIGQSMGSQNLRSTLRREAALFAAFGISWRFRDTIDLKAQLQTHSSLYRNFLTQMNAPSTMLTVGATFRLTENLTLDLAMGENLRTDTIPDFILNSALSTRF